ncbi:gliding motility protein GldM [Inquilinus sp. KBS0705]|nr:gliding motility protein GldM [Inquilinus sp. KBS0705]
MAGGKETPRQRMMGILYLVLLGLVALSLPDSLFDAFKNITDSLDRSKSNVQTGISNTFEAFEKTKLKEQPARATPFYNRAKEASKASEELNTYIETLKKDLVVAGGGFDETTNDFKGRSDQDISSHYMIAGGHGKELRKKIEETQKKLLSLLDPDDRKNVKFSLQVVDPPRNGELTKKSWEEATFGDGIPMGASITALTKIQADAKNAENEVVKKLLGKVDQAVVNLDKFDAVAVAPSSYVIAGTPYTAEVFLTASDSKSSPDISVNGSRLAVSDGKGKYTVGTGSEGVFTWVGTIRVKQTDGTIKEYKTTPQTYQVSRPSAVVSPDKMNVLYIGVPNPISVSAPGLAKEKLRVNISNGSLSGSAGHYVANVNSIGEATVTVSGEVTPGKTQTLGSTLFRVKRIPDPKAQFAGKSGGNTSAANIRAQDRVFAKLENFEFDAKFNVTRFTLVVIKPRQDAVIASTSGPELSAQMRAAMAGVTPGSTVVFKDIIAVGPDGSQRGLDAIVLTAN